MTVSKLRFLEKTPKPKKTWTVFSSGCLTALSAYQE
jgi:hypothetical protein